MKIPVKIENPSKIFEPLNNCCDFIFELYLSFQREVFDDWDRSSEIF